LITIEPDEYVAVMTEIEVAIGWLGCEEITKKEVRQIITDTYHRMILWQTTELND
jgi:hypothetical protein